ncbi:MAG: hypothetical protein DCC75_14165 [Proteobacteria bacterium]|nr:MAG: hypothetical protein DCC75_14165 [Pseudomonadota bacterium]
MIRKISILMLFAFLGWGCVQKPKPSDTDPNNLANSYLTHIVKFQGETLAVISKWYTGDSQNWQRIQAANPGLDVRRMRMGQVIRIPRILVIKETPLPASAIGSTRNPRQPDRQPQEEVVVLDEPAPIIEETLQEPESFDDVVIQDTPMVVEEVIAPEVAPAQESDSSAAAAQIEEILPPGESSAADSEVQPSAAQSGSVITEPRVDSSAAGIKTKTREELLKELLEE